MAVSGTILSVVAGTISGLLAAVVVVRWSDQPAKSGAAKPTSEVTEQRPLPVVAVPIARTTAEEDCDLPAQPTNSARPPEPSEPPRTPAQRSELRQHYIQVERDLQAERVMEHELSARDGRWAQAKELAIGDAFKTLSSTASLDGLNCRSVSCVAKLTWPTGAQSSDAASIVEGSGAFAPECVRHLVFDNEAGDGPRTASVVFDCDTAKRQELEGNVKE